jgi:hypothetical protein
MNFTELRTKCEDLRKKLIKENKIKFSYYIDMFENELLSNCVFMFFLYFNNVNNKSVTQFRKMVLFCYKIFFNSKIQIKETTTKMIEQLKKIKDKEKFYQNEYSYVFHNVKDFKEIEFLSFTYYMLYFIKKYKLKKYKINSNKMSTLKERTMEILQLMNELDKNNINKIFRRKKNVDIFSHFNDNFESGIPNIFSGSIPTYITEDKLYKFIKQLSNEINEIKPINDDKYYF